LITPARSATPAGRRRGRRCRSDGAGRDILTKLIGSRPTAPAAGEDREEDHAMKMLTVEAAGSPDLERVAAHGDAGEEQAGHRMPPGRWPPSQEARKPMKPY
jgi:hypothetical protein